MRFKILYSSWCGIPVVAGLFYICRDIGHPYNKLFGLDSTVGLASLQLGLLNLLNGIYGSSKPGIRFVAVGVNVLLLGLLAWMIRLFAKDHYTLFVGFMAVMTLFSLFNKNPLKN